MIWLYVIGGILAVILGIHIVYGIVWILLLPWMILGELLGVLWGAAPGGRNEFFRPRCPFMRLLAGLRRPRK